MQDVESEAAVSGALRALMRGRTTLLIAHRLSTVRQASRIIVVKAGRVVEQGSHQQLMRLRDGVYAGMIRQAESASAETVDGSLDESGAVSSRSMKSSVREHRAFHMLRMTSSFAQH